MIFCFNTGDSGPLISVINAFPLPTEYISTGYRALDELGINRRHEVKPLSEQVTKGISFAQILSCKSCGKHISSSEAKLALIGLFGSYS